MSGSSEIIQQCEERFAELSHKGFEWCSFYNGYLEGRILEDVRLTDLERLVTDMLSIYHEDEKERIVTSERVEAWRAEAQRIFPNIKLPIT